MRIKLLSSIFLLFFITTISAQVSVGLKYSTSYSGMGEIGKYNKETLYNKGAHYAFLFNIGMSKYLSIGLEPGIIRKDFDLNDFVDLVFIDIAIISEHKVHEIDFPINCMIRYPFFEDRLAVYSKIGIRANYRGEDDIFIIDSDRTIKQIVKEIDHDFGTDDLVFYHSLGFGTSIHFGRHQVILELERFKRFADNSVGSFFNENWEFKEVQFGVGYLFAI